MKGLLIRFTGEMRAQLILLSRYWAETVAIWVGFIFIFIAIFFGIELVTGGVVVPGWGDEIAIRYSIWILCLPAILGLPQKIQEEAMIGVLEQRFLAPKGATSSLIMSHVGMLLVWLFGTTLIFLILVLVSRTPVHFNVGMMPIVFLILIGITGVGFLLAGLALLVKRIGAVTQLLQTALLGLALIPTDPLPDALRALFQMFPLTAGLPLLNDLLLNRTAFSAVLGSWDFWVLLISSFAYLGLGMMAFEKMASRAKQTGALGQY